MKKHVATRGDKGGKLKTMTDDEVTQLEQQRMVRPDKNDQASWKSKMRKIEMKMSLVEEEIVRHIGVKNFSQEVQDIFNLKETLKASKPNDKEN